MAFPRYVIAAPALLLTLLGSAISLGAQKQPSREAARQALVEKYNRESKPKGKIKIAVQLTEADLKELIAAYKSDEPGERGTKGIAYYLAALELLRTAVKDAQNAGASKDAEVRLRKQIRDLEQLKFNLSYEERNLLQPASEGAEQAHREALDVVMK